MTRILVADDEPDLEILIKQKFRQKIREEKYHFIFATNGNEALQKLQECPDIDILLSDINMPEMDGLSLLAKLPDTCPLVKSVIVSAYGDMENIRMAMNYGAFDFVTKPINFEDLNLTIEKTLKQVAQTKETLRAIKENNILKMYVDANVLNHMESKEFEASITANETIEATVCFVDICGFTAISETERPDVVVEMLNHYLDLMVQEIIAQQGIIDKFQGDCVMAVFKGAYHADRALDACLAIRNRINKQQPIYGYAPKVSIGMNTGEMVTGNFGSSTLRRLDYTVIGDVVNTAQRLQSLAGENQILITAQAFEKVKASFDCREIGPQVLKNKQGAVVLYEVLQ